MDAVLGLSMTPTSVGLVLVEGLDADGATMDRDAFDVRRGAAQEHAAAAVRRTQALAADRGVRLHSIGVTWSEDADDQASQLMRSLSASGYDNVVTIRMPEATEALARGIAHVIGYQTTAVCVIEPETVIALIVRAGGAGGPGAVQTVFNHAIDTEESLIAWLSTIFAKADWQPQALVVVGSAGGFDDIVPVLEESLAVPVFSPEEAELALARGAALASTSTATELPSGGFAPPTSIDGRPHRHPTWPTAQLGAIAMLVAGVVTFVASVAVAISLQLEPEARPVEPARAVPSAANSPAPAPPRVVAPPEAPAAPEPAPPEVVIPPEAAVPPEPVPGEGEAPAEPEYPAGEQPPLGTSDPNALPPQGAVPPAVAPPVPAAEPKKPLHTRIMDRLRGINDPDPAEVPVAPAAPVPGVPPPVVP